MNDVCPECGVVHEPRTARGQPRCLAHRQRREGETQLTQCGSIACKGKATCKIHSGSKLVRHGATHPNFSHGRWSAYVPRGIRDRWVAAEADSELVSTRRAIALCDARITELLERIDAGGSDASAIVMLQLLDELEEALAAEDGEPGTVLERLRASCDATLYEGSLYREIQSWLEHQRRQQEAERKRIEAMQQTMTFEDLRTLIAVLVDILDRNIPDRTIYARVVDAIGEEITRPAR